MPVELRAATADAQGNTPTATPAAPAGAAAGDLLLAFHASDVDGNFAAMTAPAGWTQIGLGPTGATLPFLKVWQKVATGSESTSYGFPDSTGANGSAAIVALYGQHASTPVSAGPTFSSSTTASTSHVAPSVTGVAGGVLLTAHYDSVAAGPGAGDDGAGVAAVVDAAAEKKRRSKRQTRASISRAC